MKSGASKGVNASKLSTQCWEQAQKVEKMIASLYGEDASLLEPGYYSKLLLTPLQTGWKWNPKRLMWSTVEDSIDTKLQLNPLLVKYTPEELISKMPEVGVHMNFNYCNDCNIIKLPFLFFDYSTQL